MAWNPSPKVADCRDIARKWKKQQIIILAIDTEANTMEYASYGETRVLCDDAKEKAEVAFAAIHKHCEEWFGKFIDDLFAKRALPTPAKPASTGGAHPGTGR